MIFIKSMGKSFPHPVVSFSTCLDVRRSFWENQRKTSCFSLRTASIRMDGQKQYRVLCARRRVIGGSSNQRHKPAVGTSNKRYHSPRFRRKLCYMKTRFSGRMPEYRSTTHARVLIVFENYLTITDRRPVPFCFLNKSGRVAWEIVDDFRHAFR